MSPYKLESFVLRQQSQPGASTKSHGTLLAYENVRLDPWFRCYPEGTASEKLLNLPGYFFFLRGHNPGKNLPENAGFPLDSNLVRESPVTFVTPANGDMFNQRH
jgi:hypothetical protein